MMLAEFLPPDLLSECLTFLPPNDIRTVARLVPTSERNGCGPDADGTLRSPPNYYGGSAERAAWLMLMEIARRAGRPDTRREPGNAHEWTGSGNIDGATEKKEAIGDMELFKIVRYSNETWLGLYSLIHRLSMEDQAVSNSAQQHTSRHTETDDDESQSDVHAEEAYWESDSESAEDENGSREGDGNDADGAILDQPLIPSKHSKARFALWLLFDTTLPHAATRQETITLKKVARNIVGSVERCECSHARIVQAAIRLGDSGMWDEASDALSASASSFPTTDMNTDAEIHTCSFIIDRMYSQTYVRHSEKDSADLARAVHSGRSAVRESLRILETDRSDISTSFGDDADKHDCKELNLPPEPIATLFENNHERLNCARLSLARALALLAQHIGLGATDPFETEEIRALLEVNHAGNYTTSTDLISELFFLEALNAIDALFADLTERAGGSEKELDRRRATVAAALDNMNEMEKVRTGVGNDTHIDQKESLSAEIKQSAKKLKELNKLSLGLAHGYAVRGELFYCAASVNTSSSDPVLAMGEQFRRGRFRTSMVTSLIRRSVAKLRHGVERALDIIASKPSDISVPVLLGHHRSLLLFLIRSSKDLGKVYQFASGNGLNIPWRSAGEVEDGALFLQLALVITLRLYGEQHPTAMNIRNLSHFRIERTQLEDRVNAWLSNFVYLYHVRE